MKLNNYELKKLSKLLKDYLEVTFNSTVATKIPHRIFAMELLQKMKPAPVANKMLVVHRVVNIKEVK